MKVINLATLPPEPVSHNARISKKVMVRFPDLLPLTQFAQAILPSGEIATGHRHADMHEVFWVESGAGEMAVDNEVVTLQPGVCVVVECGEMHELRNTGTAALVVTYFGIRADAKED